MSKKHPEERFVHIQQEAERRVQEKKNESIPTIYIVMSTCGLASGAAEIKRCPRFWVPGPLFAVRMSESR